MAYSDRKALRQAAAKALKGHTDAEDRVYPSRVTTVLGRGDRHLPMLLVYTQDESAAEWNAAPRMYRRDLQLVVEVLEEADSGVDDQLDDIAAQVERAIEMDDTLGGLADHTLLQSSTQGLDDSTHRTLGVHRMIYEVSYIQHALSEEDLYSAGNAVDEWERSTEIDAGGHQALSEHNYEDEQ